MPMVTGEIPNFINGVSQQTAAMRLPSQLENSTNFYPTVVDGNTRRPPTEFMANLAAAYPGSFTHIILRDDEEKYVLVIDNTGAAHVFDFDGVAQTLTQNTGSYLTLGITDYATDLRALTVADHTFVVNKNRTVGEGGTYSAAGAPGEALVNVLAGNYAKTYKINIAGVAAAEYTTPDGDTAAEGAYVDTSYIAAELVSDLVTNGFNTAPWSVARYGDTILILNSSTDFSIHVEDGYGGRAMKAVHGAVQKFSDLPTSNGYAGMVIKVTGSEGEASGDYYVEFEKTNVSDFHGVWRETVAKNTRLGIDQNSMPHKLVRNADSTWTFEAATWDDRIAGDYTSNPNPSFVGETIQDVFFHNNRLGLLTAENAVLSESGSFYNFFRTSMITLLDTDPIDIAASHVKVSLLKHAVPFNGSLLCFSDKTQFALKGNELLTPKTAHMDPLTELAAHPTIRPESAGTNIYFVSERESYATLNEYFLDKAFESADFEDVSAHAPNFVPAGVHDIAASSDLNLVVMATSGDPDALYTYRFLWNGKEKIQSAWTRWQLPGATILNIAFDKNWLVVLLRRDGTLRLERINCEQGSTETYYMDTRATIATGVYDAGTGKTTYTSPYPLPSTYVVVTKPNLTVIPGGVELTPTTTGASTFTVTGNYAAVPVYVGVEYESRKTLSEQFYRDQNRAAIQAGRLTLLAMDLMYARSAYFRVEVTPQGRDTNTTVFTGRIISDTENVTGEIVTDSGRFSFPIMSRSDRVTIEIVNDTWLPCAFTSAKWKGMFNPNSRQT